MTKQEQRAKLVDEMRAIDELAKKESRSLTAEEQKSFDDKAAEARKLLAEIEAEKRADELAGFSSELPQENGEPAARKSGALFAVEKRNGMVELRTDMKQGTAASPGGGYAIAPQEFYDQLEKEVEKEALLYARVDKIPVSGAGSLGLPYEATDATDASWTQEVPSSDISADSAWAFGKRELNPNNLNKLIKISKQLLVTSALPIDRLAMDKIRAKLVAAFESAIVSGDGSGKPLGIFTASNDGIPTSRDVATATALTIAADDVIDVYMSLRPAYRKNAVWIMNTAFLKDIMKLKDKNDQYLWHESLRLGEPSTLLGLPVLESEYAPATKTGGSYALALADLSHYKFAYWKGLDVTIANELFAGKNQVGFFGHTLADGMPTLPAAFARLKLTAQST